MPEYLAGQKAQSDFPGRTVETWAGKGENGKHFAVIRISEKDSAVTELIVAGFEYPDPSDAHLKAREECMNYFNVSRASNVWTEIE